MNECRPGEFVLGPLVVPALEITSSNQPWFVKWQLLATKKSKKKEEEQDEEDSEARDSMRNGLCSAAC